MGISRLVNLVLWASVYISTLAIARSQNTQHLLALVDHGTPLPSNMIFVGHRLVNKEKATAYNDAGKLTYFPATSANYGEGVYLTPGFGQYDIDLGSRSWYCVVATDRKAWNAAQRTWIPEYFGGDGAKTAQKGIIEYLRRNFLANNNHNLKVESEVLAWEDHAEGEDDDDTDTDGHRNEDGEWVEPKRVLLNQPDRIDGYIRVLEPNRDPEDAIRLARMAMFFQIVIPHPVVEKLEFATVCRQTMPVRLEGDIENWSAEGRDVFDVNGDEGCPEP